MKAKDIRQMSKEDREKKLKELKIELVKARAMKIGSSKTKQIKKMIARIHTFNTDDKEVLTNK